MNGLLFRRNEIGMVTAMHAILLGFACLATTGGFASEPPTDPDPPEGAPQRGETIRSAPAQLLQLLTDSDVTYEIDYSDDASPDRFLRQESKRFRQELELGGDSVVDCRRGREEVADRDTASSDLIRLLRCFTPDDDNFARARTLASDSGLRIRELDWMPPGHLDPRDDGTALLLSSDSASWMFYFLAKAAWRHEPELRKEVSGTTEDDASLMEELFALIVLAGARANSEGNSAEAGGAPEDNVALDAVIAATEQGLLRGFALYEVIHRAYGIPLDALSSKDAAILERYLRTQVLVPEDAAPEDPR